MEISWFINKNDIITKEELSIGSIYELSLGKCPTVPEGIPVPIHDSQNKEIGSCEVIIDKITKLKKIKIISLNN